MSHPIQNRSFWRHPSQPISWLSAKKLNLTQQKQTKHKSGTKYTITQNKHTKN